MTRESAREPVHESVGGPADGPAGAPDGWGPDDARVASGIDDWGAGYFTVDARGHVAVLDPADPDAAPVSLHDVARGLQKRGLEMPVLLRIDNLLEDRIRLLNEAFASAIGSCGYANVYRGVYPIKVNQQRHVIERIAEVGARFEHGFEAGSKAELVIALASMRNRASPLVCNGFKDAEFVRLALLARKLGIECFLVVENPEEIPLIVAESRAMGVCPAIGVRVKLSSKVDGHWQADSGDRSIFGLSPTRLVQVVDALREADMLDCLRLLHAHIGSQIPNIRNVRTGTLEAVRIYAELVREGAALDHLDMGGGLGVDYDGSASNTTHSMNYGLDEYCVDLVEAVVEALAPHDLPHPVLMTESGRATVAYSSVLLFDVLNVADTDPVDVHLPGDTELPEALEYLVALETELDPDKLQEALNDAEYYRDQVRTLFRRGQTTLRVSAAADNAYQRVAARIVGLLPRARRVTSELQALAEARADIYYGNFSVFQSLPDSWAIAQVFPVMPIHRLDERPDRLALIADLTCDSDGRLDRFAHPAGERRTLALHRLREGEDYLLGVFLVGAYQETLGDLHNLFGDTNVASVRVSNGAFELVDEIVGDTIGDVLSYVEYDPRTVAEDIRRIGEAAVRDGRLDIAGRQLLIDQCAASLRGYTYFERQEETSA